MPYKDHDKKIEAARKWRERKISEGYGKALYARRAHRYRNEEVMREGIEQLLAELQAPDRAGRQSLTWITAELMEILQAAPPISLPIDYMPSLEELDDTMERP